jgi:serine protease Do
MRTRIGKSACIFLVLAGLWIPALGAAADALTPDEALARRRTPVVEAVEKVTPSVVNISTERLVPVSRWGSGRGNIFSSPLDDLFRMFPGPTYYQRRTSLGSGVLVDPEGYIITNAHVVSRASQIVVTLSDGNEYEAQLIGEDPDVDIAVLKTEEGGSFAHLPFGSSDDLLIGETVIAIGNPFGLHHTVTTGVLSAREREVSVGDRTFPGLIQTDAAINPGNSGGPLVNINGDLIGINTAIQAGAEGIGFAIPVRRVKRIYEELVYDVVSLEESLGLSLQEVTPAIASYFDLDEGRGVLVVEVEEGGLGEECGLRRGDLIVALDEGEIGELADYYRLLDRHETGDLLLRCIRERGNDPVEVRITPDRTRGRKQGDTAGPWFGLTVSSMDNRTARKNGWELDDGVVVAEVQADSEAEAVGIRRGDLIMYIGRFEIRSVADFKRAAREYATEPRKVQFQVWRPGFRGPVVVTLERIEA